MKHIGKISFLIISIFFLNSCGSNNVILNPQQCKQNGFFCYKGINYGKDRGPEFRQGVKDGCKTGEGTFTKDYSLSSSSKDYFDGWIMGRSKCKQILPNEGTLREEYNSRLRAEYQIRQLKLQQNTPTSTIEEKVDTLLDQTKEPQVEEVEY